MTIEVQYGDIMQAAHYGKLAEHMAKFARDAEAAAPYQSHTINVKYSSAVRVHDAKIIAAALDAFEKTVEEVRDFNEQDSEIVKESNP